MYYIKKQMNKIKKFNIILSLLLLFPVHALAQNYVSEKSIAVMSSSSLTEVLTELIREYVKDNEMTISASYDSPSELSRRVSEGENSDIFISEQSKWISDLKQKGLLDVYTITNLAKNSLVLVSDSQNYIGRNVKEEVPIEKALKNINEKVILVIADHEEDPLGFYTKEALEKLGYWEKINPMTLRATDSTNALYLISKGESAGITYFSDAFLNPEVKIISSIPENLHENIVYQAAVVAGENMEEARMFLEFLKSETAKKTFEKHGFSVF